MPRKFKVEWKHEANGIEAVLNVTDLVVPRLKSAELEVESAIRILHKQMLSPDASPLLTDVFLFDAAHNFCYAHLSFNDFVEGGRSAKELDRELDPAMLLICLAQIATARKLGLLEVKP